MNKLLLLLLFLLPIMELEGQIEVTYQKPPKEILDLVDVSLAPLVRMDNKAENMVLMYRDAYKSIQELSEKELRLGGLRINPKTNISSRARYYKSIAVKKTSGGKEKKITGLPDNARLANFSWSPDEKKMAFTNTTMNGVELWLLDIATATVSKLTSDRLNANMGSSFTWYKDSKSLLVRFIPNDKKELITESAIPTGPTISENSGGKKAQNRTYQDLLKNVNDEANFEQLVRSELYKVSIDGEKKLWKSASMYRGVGFSPDGKYVLITEIERPFSYIVPYSRFPFNVVIYDLAGKKVTDFMKVPLIEDLPQGFMSVRKGKRNLSWRADKPATLYWCEALDEGDPENEVRHRDEIFEVDAPFTGEKRFLFKTEDRFYDMDWGNDELAIAYDYWWNSRNTKAYLFNPSKPKQEARKIYDRNYQDKYNDPGEFITQKNQYGRATLSIDNGHLFMIGEGFSDDGKKPFVDKMDIASFKTERLWRADSKEKLESISDMVNVKEGKLLTRIESPSEYPNYYFRYINAKEAKLVPITAFENPFKSMGNIHKELIKYKREDGVELSATLYLPADYDMDKKEKLPMVMWAYPREFKDKGNAGQVTNDSNEFTYPYYGSPIYWVMKGYAVLDDAAFPIIGEGKEEPNDSFMKQLVGNAKAAIDAVDEMGYVDRERVAVGGHSYGAFMTANLLSHSNLFAAGIARSGAYNRTLTPFGFQSEERNYWESPDIYYEMSPFMHADKMKTPLLLIHGEADNNSGTYPMQSERYFNALKGLGATVRLVLLPKESHGYVAKESILHLLWEQDQWLDKYVKNKGKEIKMTD
jgi:dipeptidyl aminopeptidase/acylaminoacyl peptidase